PNNVGVMWRVAECCAQLRYESGQTRTRHVNPWPQQLVQLVVGDDRGSALDQGLEQFVHLGLEGHDLASTLELPCTHIAHPISEGQSHDLDQSTSGTVY